MTIYNYISIVFYLYIINLEKCDFYMYTDCLQEECSSVVASVRRAPSKRNFALLWLGSLVSESIKVCSFALLPSVLRIFLVRFFSQLQCASVRSCMSAVCYGSALDHQTVLVNTR
jgi:hypothetical protein